MSELDDFIARILPRLLEAGDAAHNGDPTRFLEMWSTNDPVSLFPAFSPGQSGWDAVTRTMSAVGSRFSNGTPLTFELVAAEVSGDLAYTVGYERSSVSVDGGPVKPNNLRVTHIYRRENGDWRLVHRHGDFGPSGPPALDRFKADTTSPAQAKHAGAAHDPGEA